jgi:subtilisin family serine protease
MKGKHIILRSASVATGDIFLGPQSIPGTGAAASFNPLDAGGLAIDIEDIDDRRKIPSITRTAGVLAIAPVIPMRLIKPVNFDAQSDPQPGVTAEEIAWGVKAVGADTSLFSGDGITVAVLDTGVDASHPAFSGVSIIQRDFTGEGNGDQNGHGTHCAGTIFGRITDGTRIGVAPGIKKALIGKVLGEQGGGSSEMIISAIQWAVENGANIISMSLGIDFPGFVRQLEENGLPTEIAASRALEGFRANVLLFERLASLIRAQSQGGFSQPTIIVAAAGNESQRNVNADFEVAVSPPAVSEGIISVAALGQGPQGFTVAPFSNTFANVSGPGVGIISARAGGGLRSLSGTSMATPHVAGVAALWAEKLQSLGMFTSLNLTARLIGSGTINGLQSGLDPFDIGAGMVQTPQS